ncbi:MAG: alpha/beta hydrolase [Rhodobacteraceae bacterium]|nr:alpha/beta hydrolase [Paracoccaceae bacterium]
MTDRFCETAQGIRICYRITGTGGTPLILIAGLGLQLISWPQAMIDGLVAEGFRVIAMDNRDVGQSGRIDAPPPSRIGILLGRVGQQPYDLSDMAGDVIAVLDAEGIAAAHVVGMSMGGMIGQCLAARHPGRVLSLTSIFSSTGAPKVGQPKFRTILAMMRPPPRTSAQAARFWPDMARRIGGDDHPPDTDAWARYGTAAWARGGAAPEQGTLRQLGAIIKSGDRTAELARIAAPTLVLHGDRDPLVAASGGRATARAIPGARLEIVQGMGHDLAPGVISRIVRGIAEIAAAPVRA